MVVLGGMLVKDPDLVVKALEKHKVIFFFYFILFQH